MKKTNRRGVALLIDTSTGWGRRLIRGITNYTCRHSSWDIWLEPHGQDEPIRLPQGWEGDGVIARVSTPSLAEHLAERSEPIVNVSSIQIGNANFPRVTTDTESLVHIALSHFRDRGIQHLGYVGLPHRAYSLERQRFFQSACAEAGFECRVFTPSARKASRSAWASNRSALRDWLIDAPKPFGILTWGIRRGMDLSAVASECGVLVPDEISVLCGDDDELLCEAVTPSLSGIVVASGQIGYQAAQLLDGMMDGKDPPEESILIEPSGVRCRVSTDVLALDDADVVAAIRFIRSGANQVIQVSDVAHAVAVNRRSLERRFQRALGRTIGDEIARVRLDRAKRLLEDTDLPIPSVASASGFGSPEYMATTFRKQLAISPLKYRAKVRAR